MTKSQRVHRPTKKYEYEIIFGSTSAAKGWSDLVAVRKNDLVDAWDFLTKSPTQESPLNTKLRGDLGTVNVNGEFHELWQHKLSATFGARIWFYVVGAFVVIHTVHTKHPNETK